MKQVERSVEYFIAGTHAKENWSRSVVDLHDGVACFVHEFVATTTLKTNFDCETRTGKYCSKLPEEEWYASGANDN